MLNLEYQQPFVVFEATGLGAGAHDLYTGNRSGYVVAIEHINVTQKDLSLASPVFSLTSNAAGVDAIFWLWRPAVLNEDYSRWDGLLLVPVLATVKAHANEGHFDVVAHGWIIPDPFTAPVGGP